MGRRSRFASIQRFADMAAAQFDSELDYDGPEIKRRIQITAHLLDPDHPELVVLCTVCVDDDNLYESEASSNV